MRRRILAILTIVLLGATPGAAQRRWEISGTFGSSSGSAGDAIMAAMSAAGLNSTYAAGCFLGWCWGPQYHPARRSGGLMPTLAVSYAVRPWWTLRLQRTTADLGETSGYREPGNWLSLRQSVTSVSALAVIGAGGLHMGVGPALHRLAVTRMEWDETSSRGSKLGMTFHGGLSLPARSRVFADLVVQYQLVGSMDIGPYSTADSMATMPRTRASFSHRTIKVGMGVRL